MELTAEQTYTLRRSELRAGTPTDEVRFDEDSLASTVHLGVEVDGEVVAVSTWIERRHPDTPRFRGVQLRGMATAPQFRGHGHGAMLLEAGVERAAAAGIELIWARARDSALGFYERHGFRPFGRGYVDLTTELPHHDIVRMLR